MVDIPLIKVIECIEDYQRKESRYCTENYQQFCDYAIGAISSLIAYISEYNYVEKSHLPIERGFQIIILKNNLGTLYSSYKLLLNGSHIDSLILLRSVYESILKILFCSYYPDDANSVLVDKAEKGRRQFNATDFVKNTLKKDWDHIYKLLCTMSHSNNFQTLQEIVARKQKRKSGTIEMSLRHNEDMLKININLITFILWHFLAIAVHLFTPSNTGYQPKFIIEIHKYFKILGEVLKNLPSKFSKDYLDARAIYERLNK